MYQCSGEGVCDRAVQLKPGHSCLQGAPKGLPRPDKGEAVGVDKSCSVYSFICPLDGISHCRIMNSNRGNR